MADRGRLRGRGRRAGDTVLVFPDCGSHWSEAATELFRTAPAFAAEMRHCDAAFSEFFDWSLLDVVRDGGDSVGIDAFDVNGPVSFAMMVSLAALWRAWGIEPDAVIGHSQGEIAAAYVAKAVSLRDAAKVVAVGSAAMRVVAETVGASGWLDMTRDANSNHVEELRETLRVSFSTVRPRVAEAEFISTVTGAALDPSILDGEYWFANLRQPPLFDDAVRWSYGHGYRTFLEASPHPMLAASIHQSLADCGAARCMVGVLAEREFREWHAH